MQNAKKSSHKMARRWFLEHAVAARTWIMLSVALGLGGGLLLILQARFLARIVHRAFIEGRGTESLWPLFAALAGIIILRSILGWAREIAGFYAGARIRQEIRKEFLEHIVALGPGYTRRQSSGALASLRARIYRFELQLLREDDWQLRHASWAPASIVAFE